MRKGMKRALALLCALALTLTGADALSVDEAREILSVSYVDTLPYAAHEAETLEELFACFDEYTCYYTAEEYAAFLALVEGEESFTGIGAEIVCTEAGIALVSVLAGGGAERAGLTAGDVIVGIDGSGCVPAEASAADALRGEAGTRVLLTVRRADGSEQLVTVTRTRVTLHNTTVTAEDGVGYINCDSFGTQTGSYFREGVKKYNSSVRAWVVDLRGNGGGLTTAAAEALGVFAGAGDYVTLVSRYGVAGTEGYHGAALTQRPLIVLMDGESASASEIFALGASGTETGIVLGTRSYGKGVAQVVYDEESCPYLSGDAVKVTAYRFYGALGCTSDRIGVLPTLCIPQEELTAAAELLAGAKTAESAYLRLVLNGNDFYVDTATTERAALRAILNALAPDAELYWNENDVEQCLTPAEARERCGFDARGMDFGDVSGHAYETEINTLAAYGIVLGDGGSFRPDDTMTRAEVCALLAQALGISGAAEGPFADVAAEDWYAPAVNAMAELGLVSGVGGGKFSPNATMTQEEYITVLGRLAEFLSLDAQAYLDVNPLGVLQLEEKYQALSTWAIRAAALLTEGLPGEGGSAHALFGAALGDLVPSAAVTRAEAAASLCGVLRAVGALKY